MPVSNCALLTQGMITEVTGACNYILGGNFSKRMVDFFGLIVNQVDLKNLPLGSKILYKYWFSSRFGIFVSRNDLLVYKEKKSGDQRRDHLED